MIPSPRVTFHVVEQLSITERGAGGKTTGATDMTTKQPEALPALIERFRSLHFDHAPDGWPAVRTREITALLDRITELESQLAQRFDATDMATAAAQGFRDGATAPARPVAAPATRQGGAYAALPVPNYPKSGGFPGTFAEAQMRAFADATCALRASHGQAPAGAAPECLTCNDHGAVGNILTARATQQAGEAAESVPAVEREQERIAFKDAHRHLDLDEVPDAWGRPMFKHSHVEASWLGWIARASHGEAPASKIEGLTAAQESLGVEFERVLYDNLFDLYEESPHTARLESARADSVQEDAALWHWLAEYLVGTRTDLDDEIVASETVNDLRKLVEAAIKQGEKQ